MAAGKHGVKARRTWRKLHLAVDAGTGMIMSSTLTENDAGDPSQVAPLLDRIDAEIGSVTADGAYDGAPTYNAVAARAGNIPVIIPPHVTAVLSDAAEHRPSQRDNHITLMKKRKARLAEGIQLRSALACRDDDGSIQGHHRSRPTRTKPAWPTHESGGRRGCAQPHATHRTAKFHSPLAKRFLRMLWEGLLSSSAVSMQ